MSELWPHSAYKDSGIGWLPQIPTHWRRDKISRVSRLTVGWTPPTGDASSFEGDNLWANISDLGPRVISDTSKRISDEAVSASRIRKSPEGSLLFSFKLSVGQVSFAGCDMYTNEAIATFLETSAVALPYAYYAFPIFIVENASENIYGAKILNQSLIGGAHIAVPPLDEQRAIALFLDHETDEIDAFIADQEELIELLNERRTATITQAVSHGLNTDAQMKESGNKAVPHFPSHWVREKLSRLGLVMECGTSVNGFSDPEDLLGARVLKTGCASKGYFDPSENKKVVEEDLPRVSCPVRAGSLVVNRANTPELVGSVALVDGDFPNLYLSDKLWQINFTRSDNRFMFWWMKTNSYKSQIKFHMVGASASMQNLSFSDFRSFAIALPPLAEQVEIANYLDFETAQIDAAIADAKEAIALSKERRSALISAAVTGKIDVRDHITAELGA